MTVEELEEFLTDSLCMFIKKLAADRSVTGGSQTRWYGGRGELNELYIATTA